MRTIHPRSWPAVAAVLLISTTAAQALTVTNVNDSGAGSLRQAILDANATAAQDTISFNISGSGVHAINLLSALPAISHPVFIFGNTQPGYNGSPLIQLNGANAGSNADGLRITGGGSVIVGLAISAFGGDGIELSFNGGNSAIDNVITGNKGFGVRVNAANNNTIAGGLLGGSDVQEISGNTGGGVLIEHVLFKFQTGEAGTGNVLTRNYIGLNATGTTAVGNLGDGVIVRTAGNTIGSTAAADRNVICGNGGNGITITGTAAAGNVVLGNLIGVNVNNAAVGNGATSGGSSHGAIFINNAPGNTIGGTATGARNVISAQGNQNAGIYVQGPSTGNQVQGNYIGTDISGTLAFPNQNGGAVLTDAPGTVVGGTTAAARNLISGNGNAGVVVTGDATGVLLEGNLIGTNKDGTAALANSIGVFSSASNLVIGGTSGTTPDGPCTGACNVISGNGFVGILLQNAGLGVQVQGNFIGTDPTGTSAVPNALHGVSLQDTGASTIGGTTAAARNLISGNTDDGVTIFGGGSDASRANNVQGNFIGTDITGAQTLGNGSAGVRVYGEAQENVIGGTAAGAGNVISGNSTGVVIDGTGTATGPAGTIVQGNLIGTTATGLAALPNIGAGVSLTKVSSELIGGATAAARNVISGNFIGIAVDPGSSDVFIHGNYIGAKSNGTEALGNSIGVRINDAMNNVIGTYIDAESGAVGGAGNLISGNAQNGVDIETINASANGNFVSGNLIGTDISGTKQLANAFNGVLIRNASSNTIGGSRVELRNVISGNGGSAVGVSGDAPTNTADANVIQGNYLGTALQGAGSLGNGGRGIDLSGATNTIVGGIGAATRNVISGNAMQGIVLHNETAGTVVQGNNIGSNAAGTAALGNDFEGLFIENAPANIVGGTAAGAGNLISGNGLQGIHLLDVDAHDNLVQGNFIGTDRAGAKPMANKAGGVLIKNAMHNRIGGAVDGAGNTIRFNKGTGVTVVESMPNEAKRDAIRGNEIGDNTGLGIDLGDDGVTPNDAGDGDPGANKLQNHPRISSVVASGGNLMIKGALNSLPSATYQIDLFANNSAHPVNQGQGRFFLGSVAVTTNANGKASFNVTRAVPSPGAVNVSATATGPTGNTSEFSATRGPD